MKDIHTEHIENIVDIAYHANKQDLDLDIMGMKKAFYNQHKKIYGSLKFEPEPGYSKKMQERYKSIENNIWDVIDSHCIYERLSQKNPDEFKYWHNQQVK